MSIINKLRKAAKELEKAEDMECTCSGFVLQYEGSCRCDKGRAVANADAKLHNLINKLQKENK